MRESPILIHVIDDDAALRTALTRLLQAGGFAVAAYDSAASFLAAAPAPAPGCVLLDVNMPGLSGLQLQAHLAAAGNPLPIVFLTGEGDVAMSVRAIKAGAEDYLLKPVQSEALFDAVARAVRRYQDQAQDRAEYAALAARLQTLTPREHEVFHLVIQGLLNKQIAYQLGNSERTVKEQRRSLMEKMQVDSVAGLVVAATRLGLLKPS